MTSRRAAAVAGLACLFFLLVDVALFGDGWYRRWVDPGSATGAYDWTLDRLRALPADPRRDVLVVGDSRIYSGLDPGVAARAAGGGLRFVDAAIPGTTPRVWRFLVAAADPRADRFRAVVIPVDTYGDDDGALGALDNDDRLYDLKFLTFALAPPAVLAVAASYPSVENRLTAAVGLALRAPLLRADVADFAEDPARRLAALRAAREDRDALARDHPRRGTLAGLRADYAAGTLQPPPSAGAPQLVGLERQVLARPAPSAAYARYRRQWLVPIVERYRRRGVPVLFVRIPARPLRRTAPALPSGTLAVLGAEPGVRLLPQGPFVALERPENFADAEHLGSHGARTFSAILGREVARALAARPIALASEPPAPARAPAVPTRAREARSRPAVAAIAAIAPIGELAPALMLGAPLRFQTYEFAIFFAVVVATTFALPGGRPRDAFLLVASWYFYARWNAWFLFALGGLTALGYGAGRAIEGGDARTRRAWLTVAIAANLAALAALKYAGFASGTIAALLGFTAAPWTWRAFVPIGISFHVFQGISYVADVAAGRTRAERDPLRYALYLGFFPQLLAGPIVRAGRFFAERTGPPSGAAALRGGVEIVLGLTMKAVLADRFAAAADGYFANLAAAPGALAAWTGLLAFGLQIYFDFAGYSLIAIGLARLLGFDFPQNFRRPYLAWSPGEFWHRWHITLSQWLRDYLYIPLGGNRRGELATLRNLTITMLLGGLWHGAGWTFVLWGGYQGALMCAERLAGLHRRPRPRGTARVFATLATVALVIFGWALFRAPDLGTALAVWRAALGFAAGPSAIGPSLGLLAAAAFAAEIVAERGVRLGTGAGGLALRGAGLAALLLLFETGAYAGVPAEFVYFKF